MLGGLGLAVVMTLAPVQSSWALVVVGGSSSSSSSSSSSGGSSSSSSSSSSGGSSSSSSGGTVACSMSSTIVSNFNGTAIPAGDTVWFSSVLTLPGLGNNLSAPVTISFTNQTISFSNSGTSYSLPVPNATVTFDPAATSATTTFNTSTNTWMTDTPPGTSGNTFLGGLAFPVPSTLAGGTNPVWWSGQLSSNTAGVTINWQWAAAVYTSFSLDYNTLEVKPTDDNHASAYQNSDHAGTPEAFTGYVTGGAMGGGGSNYTGSYSGTMGQQCQ
jgi:hypothetical protein